MRCVCQPWDGRVVDGAAEHDTVYHKRSCTAPATHPALRTPPGCPPGSTRQGPARSPSTSPGTAADQRNSGSAASAHCYASAATPSESTMVLWPSLAPWLPPRQALDPVRTPSSGRDCRKSQMGPHGHRGSGSDLAHVAYIYWQGLLRNDHLNDKLRVVGEREPLVLAQPPVRRRNNPQWTTAWTSWGRTTTLAVHCLATLLPLATSEGLDVQLLRQYVPYVDCPFLAGSLLTECRKAAARTCRRSGRSTPTAASGSSRRRCASSASSG